MNNRIRLIKLIILKYFKIFQIWKFCIKNHTILIFSFYCSHFCNLYTIIWYWKHEIIGFHKSWNSNPIVVQKSRIKRLSINYSLQKKKKKKKYTKRQFPNRAKNSRRILGTQCPMITSVSTHRKPFELTRGSW